MLIIGDSHGKYAQYLKLIENANFSLQIGDFGFDYSCLKDLDPNKVKLFSGNHDDIPTLSTLPHNLGDFGLAYLGGQSFFYVRGGFSIDKKRRTPGLDWFPQEELNMEQMRECYELYFKEKPSILISHEPPFQICHLFKDTGILQHFGYKHPLRTNTNTLLQHMIMGHKPKLHLMGHMHESLHKIVDGVEYRCLAELETFEL